ncbi:MAG: HEPN domain-containing protein [Thermoplasmata archaeon]|nr:HEPN domain-containing protein [Thermoplasmata archaeon]
MRKSSFLSRLKADRILELVEPSEEICSSYLKKADDCLRSSRLLLENELFENSIQMSYYTMYNSLLALLFKCGIKSENHASSILVFKQLFGREDLFGIISRGKEGRIDAQYYVATNQSEDSARAMLTSAEEFLVELKLIITNMKFEDIGRVRTDFDSIT